LNKKKYKTIIPDLDYYKNTIKCQNACPVGTNAREYVLAIANKDFEHAYHIARQCNPFASICGRVCHAFCEIDCRRGEIDEPIAIRALKRYVTSLYGPESNEFSIKHLTSQLKVSPGDSGTVNDMSTLFNLRGKNDNFKKAKVAVIGAGPAGLSCAHDLALLGHKVTVFEAAKKPGGMLRLGIPAYRLPRKVLEAEIQAILDLGVELKLNTPLSSTYTIEHLRKEGFQAFFIAVGAHKSRQLDIEGMELKGVIYALEFLFNTNMGYKMELGSKVVVVGGGGVAVDAARSVLRLMNDSAQVQGKNRAEQTKKSLEMMQDLAGTSEEKSRKEEITATIDAARVAIRMGAKEVHLVCLESRNEMPIDEEEIKEALSEGIYIHNRKGPNKITGRDNHVIGLQTMDVESIFDRTGRFNPVFIPETESIIEADTIIVAIGQKPDLSFIKGSENLQINPSGTFAINDRTLSTTMPGIYAGGDAAFGPRFVISSIADGKLAALQIDSYIQGKQVTVRRWGNMQQIRNHSMLQGYIKIKRDPIPVLPLSERDETSEVETGYDNKTALKQSQRCLKCHINTIFNSYKCILCAGCVDVCPEQCLILVKLNELKNDTNLHKLIETRYGRPVEELPETTGAAIIKEDTRCIRCGLCADRCPTGAITMEAFSFKEEITTD